MLENCTRVRCHNQNISFTHSVRYPPFAPREFHAHETNEIYCVFRGNGHYITEGTRHKLEHGKIFLMRSGESHRAEITGEEPFERMFLRFTPEIVDGFDPERRLLRPFFDRPLGLENVYDRSVVVRTGIYELFREMDALPGGDMYQNCLHVTSLLFPVLNKLCDLFDAGLHNVPSPGAELMQQVVAYVNDNLTTFFSVGQICEKFSLSQGQLNRHFKNSTGTTVWDYIITKRLILARAYLAEGMAAQEAARVCGFSDYSAFYRAYQKRYGVSPTGASRTL